MTKADDIVKYARTWVGAPWRHQGRGEGKNRGIDCAGLLIVTAKKFGLPYRDLQGYRRDPGYAFVENIHYSTDPHPEPIHGAIGIFSDTVMPCHTGIFAVKDGKITVIHSEVRPAGRVHEQPFDGVGLSLKSRLIEVRLFREVDYVG
jgi:hypothetical protein